MNTLPCPGAGPTGLSGLGIGAPPNGGSAVGPPFPWVLVRGLTREQAHWGSFPALLGAALNGVRVITLDLPGAGVLHRQHCPLRVDAIADTCRAQLREHGVTGPVNLLGLSLGGMVCAVWLHRWPRDVAAAVIVNSSARGLGTWWQRLRPSSASTLLRIALHWGSGPAQTEVLRLTSAFPNEHQGQLAEWVQVQAQRPVSRANAVRQLVAATRYRLPRERPTCRVLVVASAHDALVDPRCSQALADAWKCELVVHPDAGHDLPLDAGAWLAARIAQWTDA